MLVAIAFTLAVINLFFSAFLAIALNATINAVLLLEQRHG